jgi:hypothetical protein
MDSFCTAPSPGGPCACMRVCYTSTCLWGEDGTKQARLWRWATWGLWGRNRHTVCQWAGSWKVLPCVIIQGETGRELMRLSWEARVKVTLVFVFMSAYTLGFPWCLGTDRAHRKSHLWKGAKKSKHTPWQRNRAPPVARLHFRREIPLVPLPPPCLMRSPVQPKILSSRSLGGEQCSSLPF